MVAYRLYILNGLGKIGESTAIEARSDDEALALVRARKLANVCEIWDRGRHVADVPAFGQDTDGMRGEFTG